MTLRGYVAGTLLTLAFLLVYLPDIGHGFVRDDFRWVQAGHLAGPHDMVRIFGENTGFYRPLVTLTFGVDRALFGLYPFAYALTNLALVFACSLAISRLGLRLGLDRTAAAAAAAVWAFNFHGINMALLWISGRTALLLSLFALLATLAALRRAWWLTGVWCLAALLSKEEAVTLPFLLAGWSWYSQSPRPSLTAVCRSAAPMLLALAVYAMLRANSGAFGPATAPSYYQFTFVPAAITRNLLEYVDRSCTFAALIVLIAIALTRTQPWRRSAPASPVLTFGALWTTLGFAVTVFLPLRSSLYAVCPSIGSSLAAGWCLQRLQSTSPHRVRIAMSALVLLPLLLLPVYHQRNQRWVRPADLSAGFVADLQALSPSVPAGAHVLALDTADERLDDAFSGLFSDAVVLFVGKGVTGEIVSGAAWERRRDGSGSYQVSIGSDGHLVHDTR